MKNTTKLILAVILLLSGGCTKTESILPDGDVIGFVYLFDESGNEITDKSGVTVTLTNTQHKTVTNEFGKYEFTKVPAGTYNLMYEKEGFGKYEKFGRQFIGGNVPALTYETKIYQLPSSELQHLDVYFENNFIKINGLATETNSLSVRFFLSKSPDVSCENYEYASIIQNYCCVSAGKFSFTTSLEHTNFAPGDKVYLVTYFFNYYEDQAYYNPNLDRSFYSSYKMAHDPVELILN